MILYSLFALFAPHCKTVIEVTENEIKVKESISHDYDACCSPNQVHGLLLELGNNFKSIQSTVVSALNHHNLMYLDQTLEMKIIVVQI